MKAEQVSRSGRRSAVAVAFVGGVFAAGAAGMGGVALAAPPELFGPSGTIPASAGTPEHRSRGVAPRLEELIAVQSPGGLLTLNLFDDFSPVARVESVRRDNGYWVISGELVGAEESSVLLVAGPTTLTGEVRSPGKGAYEIRCTRGGGHLVRQIDEMGFRPCGAGPEHEVGGANGGVEEGHGVPRGVPDIRIAVFYTPLARTDEGGEEAIRGRAVFAVSQANNAYDASQSLSHLTLAHAGVVEYTETGSASTDLSRFRNTDDGFMDGVHCIRDIVGADMVALLVNDFDACGIGYIQTNPGPGFASSAFTVTDKDCISNFSFAHELGHNMGCAHDRDNAGNAAFSYAYGYRTPDEAYRTIMAYAPGTRIGRFSNPGITFQGYVLGVPLDQPNPTINALCITNTSTGISGFRSGSGTYADFNGDGVATSQDFFDFIGAFFAAAPAADFNADGTRDSQDFFDFISAFFQVCP